MKRTWRAGCGNSNSGRGRWAKYQDPDSDGSGGIPEHALRFHNDARAYTPNAGEQDGDGQFGNLAARSVEDNPFKSARRYASDPGWIWTREEIDAAYPNGYEPNIRVVEPLTRRLELELQMPTLLGVSKGAAELHRAKAFPRS